MSNLPRVLLLGDSIRMSYEPHVARLLGGKAEIVGPADNCEYCLYTLSSLDRWIRDLGRPDIVHWNNGIHDSGHNPGRSPVQIPVDMYRANLKFILDRLTALTPSELLCEDQLHLSEAGQEACARAVADCVSTFLSPQLG